MKLAPLGSAGLRAAATVAVMGNPNAGKTTIFNRLTGLSQRVGNYPGVTVEKKHGQCALDGVTVRLVDLPGTYSLAAHSPDEMVAVDVILGLRGEERPDLVLQIVDASNLERNLYLLSQVMELGVPVVVALNMVDVAASRGIRVDAPLLSRRLGMPVVPVEGHRGVGIPELRRALLSRVESLRGDERPAEGAPPPGGFLLMNGGFGADLEGLHRELEPAFRNARRRSLHRVEVLRALVDRGGDAEERLVQALGESCRLRLETLRERLGRSVPLAAQEAQARYDWVRERLQGCLRREEAPALSWSERIDRVLTHRVLGLVIFAALMMVVFQSIFVWAEPLMEGIERAFVAAGGWVGAHLPQGALKSLVVDGVISGVGMVMVFLPQIVILFLFIGLLEDCGYMARAAFLMDNLMARCGLSGKSFIPMLSGFACAVPGIMAARVIEDRRDRLATILVTPLMSCSARLPVYSIFIGTFIPEHPVVPGVLGLKALTLFSLYALGLLTAVGVAWALKKSLLRGRRPPFVLELPSYKWPAMRGVLLRLYRRAQAFCRRAGTVILAISVVVWALAYFPHSSEIGRRFDEERARLEKDMTAERAWLEEAEAGAYLRESYFGRIGQAVEPLFRPLGWDWRISMAAIASFPAREVIVATLGTIYNLGKDVDSKSAALRESLRKATWPAPPGQSEGPPVFNIPVALSIMVFFALCCQCGATVATIKRETNSWGWAWFAFGYMTVLAYLGGLLTYQVGMAL